MAIVVLNQEGFSNLSKYSGNPFLDAMVDLQDVFTTLAAYQQAKPFIDRYSDTSLSDLRDKIKAYLPEVINKDGSINFSKLEELASNGNKLAEYILSVKQHRENFAKAPIIGKLEAIHNDTLSNILAGNDIAKTANILKLSQQFDEALKKANISDDIKLYLALNKEAFLSDPNKLFTILNLIFNNQQPSQSNNTTQSNNTSQNNDTSQSNNASQSNNTSQNNYALQNNDTSQIPSSEADYIKSIIESNYPSSSPEAQYIISLIEKNSQAQKERKQNIAKPKQTTGTKKTKKKTNKNNQTSWNINHPFKASDYITFQLQSPTQYYPKTQPLTYKSALDIFLNAILHPYSYITFKSINDMIKGR